ncbi:hypothetical protein BN1058_02193 [Paraliobacillus sp. PM-2]|uniref:hypothetical protein n=1 Tax=Paraliobacillus sp. PM-2 TaxID=1462524 RepID=UPI00061CCEA0|nr:hypothetical protein [Paraliobacillus sp. PM-2]CQR47862.1 hypothetical protein BN1058_02193 [Paraliobacillus sp. PM-2]
MSKLATQTYVMIERKIEKNQQLIKQDEYTLTLHHHCIESANQKFLINNVYDITYRKVNITYFLYLHTNKGVTAFQTIEDPASFVQSFKKLKHN